jgi:hypothetical protein
VIEDTYSWHIGWFTASTTVHYLTRWTLTILAAIEPVLGLNTFKRLQEQKTIY